MTKKSKIIISLALLYFIISVILTYLHDVYEFSIDFLIFTEESFIESFVTNLWNSFIDIVLFTVILYLFLRNEEKKETIKKYHENIDDCRFWFSDEAAFKNAANIRRLNSLKLHKFDLSKSMLKGIKLKKSYFIDSKFMGSCLDNCNYESSEFKKSNFQGASIKNTKLYNSKIIECNLRYVKLIDSNLKSIKITNSNLSDTDFTNTDLTASTIIDCDFSNANLTNAILRRADLRKSQNLKVKQLLDCKDFKYAKLPVDLENELKSDYPKIFEYGLKRRSSDK